MKVNRITLRLRINPYESAARMAVSAAPVGYELERMERAYSEAVCVYRRVEAANPGAAKPEEGAK